jgi:hypothetical protein
MLLQTPVLTPSGSVKPLAEIDLFRKSDVPSTMLEIDFHGQVCVLK